MIVAHITEGLGNQMFMYAAARALAIRNNERLILDHQNLDSRDKYNRQYLLNHFNICGSEIKLLCYDYAGGVYCRKIARRIGREIPNVFVKMIIERKFEIYRDIVLGKKRNVSLWGYWQSEQYFEDCKDQIKKDFELIDFDESEITDELELIKKYGGRAVALCVRRYQEVKNISKSRVLDASFYIKAINVIKDKIKDPVFFCFSQVPGWVKDELGHLGHQIIYIDNDCTKDNTIPHFYLLQQFDNYIISNSTYYWWGAWLSKSTNKIVVTSSNWPSKATPCKSWIIID